MRSLQQAYKPGTRNAKLLSKFVAERLRDKNLAAVVSVDSEAQEKGIEADPASVTALVDGEALI